MNTSQNRAYKAARVEAAYWAGYRQDPQKPCYHYKTLRERQAYLNGLDARRAELKCYDSGNHNQETHADS